MRLHHLRIENLNSLRGEVTIDFDAGLGDAPLFLIHGPTGSGKSTLMDGVSLALFGCTPRLKDSSTSRADAIRPTDGRQIMTRGTGHCLARLIFSRLDGHRRRYFVAEWCCARARRNPAGAFQHVDRSIRELASPDPSDVLQAGLNAGGRRQADYREAFEEALERMTVDDFHRSMLLAQGEFSLFLKADAKGRADILERITDTSDYTELGRRAAERNRQEQEKVRDLASQLKGMQVLGEEERTVLETQRNDAKSRAEAHAALLSPLTDQQRWVEGARKGVTDVSSSRERLREARAEREGRQTDAERLALHRSTEAAVRTLDKHNELERRRKQNEERLGKIAVDLSAARDDQGKHLVAQSVATTAVEAAAQALQTATPDLISARALWETVRRLEADLAKAEADVTRLQEPVDRLVNELADAQRAFDEAHQNVETKSDEWASLEAWHALVEDDAPYRTMRDGCTTLVRALEVHAEATAELNRLRSTIEEKRRDLASKEAAAEPLRERLAEKRADLESATTALSGCCDEGADPEATRQRLAADRDHAFQLLALLGQVSDGYSRRRSYRNASRRTRILPQSRRTRWPNFDRRGSSCPAPRG
jgi:DNA repair protein SbcC/Rad50